MPVDRGETLATQRLTIAEGEVDEGGEAVHVVGPLTALFPQLLGAAPGAETVHESGEVGFALVPAARERSKKAFAAVRRLVARRLVSGHVRAAGQVAAGGGGLAADEGTGVVCCWRP